MEKKVITIDGFPKGGPYSHAVEAGGFLFVAGTGPVDPETNLVIDEIRAATRLVLGTLKKILESQGSGLEKAVKVNVYLRDMKDFQAMNEVYITFFPQNQPVRTCVAVRELPRNFPVEIELVAVK